MAMHEFTSRLGDHTHFQIATSRRIPFNSYAWQETLQVNVLMFGGIANAPLVWFSLSNAGARQRAVLGSSLGTNRALDRGFAMASCGMLGLRQQGSQ